MSTEAFLDARFAALPLLIRHATNPNMSKADVRRFMEDLLQADPALGSQPVKLVALDAAPLRSSRTPRPANRPSPSRSRRLTNGTSSSHP